MAARRPRTSREKAARQRALAAAGDMRRDRISLAEAARRNRTSLRTILKHTPGNFSKRSGSRNWTVKAGDSYASEMRILTAQGWRTVTVRGSKQRSLVGRYYNTVGRFKAGDEEARARLRSDFYGKQVGGWELMIDEDELQAMADRGELDDVEIYELGGSR